jgi:hypothetical protein
MVVGGVYPGGTCTLQSSDISGNTVIHVDSNSYSVLELRGRRTPRPVLKKTMSRN